ncbi:amino acid synthesis family protein [Roseibium album]|uniref:amino acid synthesis family protein n=1 Tax=Roseibium album TaxID=311410 RepID=UPI0024904CC6|nr:amino acid synthesis family protein [Roseibium album]
MNIRKTLVIEEIVETDEFGVACDPLKRMAALAVLQNPFADTDADDLSVLFEMGAELGERLAGKIMERLGSAPTGYGKAAIVGTGGAAEHGAALLHPGLGKPVRAAIGGGKALMPSNVKVAAAGATIDLPLGHKDEAWAFNFIDTMSLCIADAPRANEIVLCVGIAAGTRPRARVGEGPRP